MVYFDKQATESLYQQIEIDTVGERVVLPDGVSLQNAHISRDGSDLLFTTKTGDHYFVADYYLQESSFDFLLNDGSVLSGRRFDTLSDVNAIEQYAQASPLPIPGLQDLPTSQDNRIDLGEAIGTVETVSGVVVAVRADGSSIQLSVGDKVFQGDNLQTSEDGGVGITLADTSSFSLGEESEMVLDELVYDPGQSEGSAVLSLLEGTASYVSGQIAKINPDAVAIKTPVATIGIRGTKVFVEYVDGNFRAINLLETTLEGETAGEIVIFDIDGTPISSTNQANIGWSWDGGDRNQLNMLRLSPRDVEKLTEDVLEHLPPSLAEQALEARELEQALKEAAEIAAEEAAEAERLAQEAETSAEELEQAAELAQAQAEALLAEAAIAEAQLELLQQELSELIEQGGLASDIFLMQNELNKLKGEYDTLLVDAQHAQSAAQAAQTVALNAYSHSQSLRADYDRANTAAQTIYQAVREASETSQNSYYRATEYVGYKANVEREETSNATQVVQAPQSPVSAPVTPEKEPEQEESSNVFIPHETATQTFETEENFSITDIVSTETTLSVSDNSQETTIADDNEDPETTTNTENTQEHPQETVTALNGKAVDGYLSGATVFVDLDKDGVQDANETDSTTTDSLGNYSLSTTASDYIISMIGGSDIATGKAFYGVLKAPAGSSVVTPLTTLLTNGVSEDALKTAFGLSSSLSLTSTDPVAGATDSTIAKLAAIGVQLQNTILQAASVIEGAASGDLDDGSTGGAVFNALANAINTQGASFDISDATKLQSVITTAAGSVLSGAELTTATNAAANTAQIISSSNSVIDGYISSGGTGNDFLSSLAQVAVVASDAASALESTVGSGGDLSALQTQYSSSNLTSKIEAASIGDVNGDGSSNTVNAAPSVSGAVNLSTNEDSALSITSSQLLANSSDTDTLTLTNLTASSGTLTPTDTGWTLTPAANSTDTITLSYFVSDGVKSTSASATVSVQAINDAPTVSANVSFTDHDEDVAITLTKAQLLTNTSDVDGDTLDVINVTVTSGGSVVDNGNETWTITPTLNSIDNVVLSYNVRDNNGGTVIHGAVIDLDPVNDAPTLSAVALSSATEDVSYTINESTLVASNVATDVDGDSLSVTNISVDHGNITDNGSSWTITPQANYNGTVKVTYTVSDGTTTSSNTVDLIYLAVNDAPTVSSTPVALNGTEDNAVTITQSQLLTNYASDVDNDTLTLQELSTTAGGGLIDNGNDTWTYTPVANASGEVNFTFKVFDGTTTTNGAATLTLSAVDDAPIVSGTATFSGVETGTVSLTPAQLLAYASDVDTSSGNLSVTDLSASSGTLTPTDSGWTFTPSGAGTVTFSYNVYDGTSKTATTATATILSTEEANTAPSVGAAISLSGDEDGGDDGYITITKTQLLSGASDANNDTLYVNNLQASSGTLIYDSSSGNWHFTPTANSIADVSFTYQVSDGIDSVNQTATLSLNAVNDVPTISDSVNLNGTEDTVLTITNAQLIANATDVEGDTLSASSLATSDGGSLVDNNNGTWSYTPATNSTSGVNFSYVISDGNGGSVNATATASFTAVNDAPTISNNVILSGSEDTDLTITKTQLLANASDVDGDNLLVQNLTTSDGGTLIYNGNDTWTYSPDANDTSNVTFSYDVSDGTTSSPTSAIASFAEDGTTEGSSGADTITGTTSADTITALAGDDLITGGLGDDTIDGGEGDDTAVFSGNAADYSFGENASGQMTITDNNGADGDDGTDVLVSIEKFQFADQLLQENDNDQDGQGADTDDRLLGGNGVDTIYGGGGNDEILSFNAADILYGGSGNDSLWGGNGNDTITGGSGADLIYGENGDDVIILSSGDVTISGGKGTDSLRLSNGDGLDLTSNTVDLSLLEVIDLQTDTASNSLTLTSSDIISMSSNDTLIIDGSTNDNVTLNDSGWSQGSTSNGYTVYEHSTSGATAQVAENLNVTSN
ncbi:cadherin-like domain-containing protein [Terasakiella sp. SH-1]|uniref:cadherin-like domain-containing protein n=1 Tax=Terasakiella sp. SH-1 TaxID=2560057 RepID=UPI0010748285|nr:cadherin-like domain-containing protein [Terasakiella sp. SH-1]